MSGAQRKLRIRVRLEELLEGLHAKGAIPRNRHGQIYREKLAEMLGYNKTALTPHLDVVKAFEDKIGIVHPIDALLPMAKVHALELISKGELRLRDNKADRSQISQKVNCPLTSYTSRFPQIFDFFEWLDNYIIETGYQPAEIAGGLIRLEAYLSNNRAVCKNGLTYDCAQIGKAVGVPPHRLRTEPYLSLIRAAEIEYERQLRAEGLTAFLHGRIFQFDSLFQSDWSRAALQRLTNTFRLCFQDRPKAVAEGGYLAVKSLLAWMAEASSPQVHLCFLRLNATPVSHPDEDTWVEMLLDYQSLINAKGSNKGRLTLALTQNFLHRAATDGLMPPMPFSFRFRERRKESRHATVAEARPNDHPVRRTKEEHVDDYLLFATEMLSQAGTMRGVQIDSEEQSAFVQTLRDELESGSPGVGENPALVIRKVLRERIDFLVSTALDVFLRAKVTFEEGQALLSRGEDCGEAWDELVQKRSGKSRHKALLNRWFPPSDPVQAKANLLVLVKNRYGGLVPTKANSSIAEAEFFNKRAKDLLGVIDVQSCLWPSPDAFAAALTLYLCKTGSNVAVGRTMPTGYLEPSQEPGFVVVKSNKDKAKGKAIIVDLERNSPVAQSILWLDEIRGRVTINAEDSSDDFLMVIRGKNDFKLMPAEWYLQWFKKLVKSIPKIAHLRMNPVMIRPTILLMIALESDSGVRASVTAGQHGEHVNQRYTGRYPLLWLHDSEMNLFNRFYETLSLQKIENAHVILGLSIEEFASRIESLARTGLGTLCGDPSERAAPGQTHCQTLDCWNDCPQLIIIPIPEEIALLLLWQRTLRLEEGDWVRDRPERWEAVWLPWLCFVDAVEARMKLSYRKVWREAQRLAERFLANPGFVTPRPW